MSNLRIASATLPLPSRRVEPDSDRSAACGLANAVVLSVPLWAAIGLAAWAVL